MIARRRKPRPTSRPGATQRPSPSGPRWTMVSRIRARTSPATGCAAEDDSQPTIPHIQQSPLEERRRPRKGLSIGAGSTGVKRVPPCAFSDRISVACNRRAGDAWRWSSRWASCCRSASRGSTPLVERLPSLGLLRGPAAWVLVAVAALLALVRVLESRRPGWAPRADAGVAAAGRGRDALRRRRPAPRRRAPGLGRRAALPRDGPEPVARPRPRPARRVRRGGRGPSSCRVRSGRTGARRGPTGGPFRPTARACPCCWRPPTRPWGERAVSCSWPWWPRRRRSSAGAWRSS